MKKQKTKTEVVMPAWWFGIIIVVMIALLAGFCADIYYNNIYVDYLNQQATALNSQSTKITFLQNQISMIKSNEVNFDFSDIISQDINSVVSIQTDIASGSGFFVLSNGYIITNYHVIDGSSEIFVNLYNGTRLPAQLIDYNDTLDLAILKVSGKYNPLYFSNSNNLVLGQKVIAIGNPLGLSFSVSEGIISSINREGDNGMKAYAQTDAALNPGNSGGALIDTNGRVVGINNFKIRGSENLGFALESNYMINYINSLNLNSSNEDQFTSL